MRELLSWVFVFLCGLACVTAGLHYALASIDASIRSTHVGPLPTPMPELIIIPHDDDPLMENMELLRLQDLEYCPRHYTQMQLNGAEFWMHQTTGKVYTKDSKGKLVSAL